MNYVSVDIQASLSFSKTDPLCLPLEQVLFFIFIQEFPDFLVSIIKPGLTKTACFSSKMYDVAI